MMATRVPAADREVTAEHNVPVVSTDLNQLKLRLDAANVDLAKRVEELAARAFGILKRDAEGKVVEVDGKPVLLKPPSLPEKVEDDKTAGRLAEFIRQCQDAVSLSNERHDEHKRPYLLAGKMVDGFYKELADTVAEVRRVAQRLADDYVTRKRDQERERLRKIETAYEEAKLPPPPLPEARGKVRGAYGAVMGAQEKWSFEITDINKIPLASLRKHLKREWLEQALRSYIREETAQDKEKEPAALKGVRFFLSVKAGVHG